jgi:hypothetical protein
MGIYTILKGKVAQLGEMSECSPCCVSPGAQLPCPGVPVKGGPQGSASPLGRKGHANPAPNPTCPALAEVLGKVEATRLACPGGESCSPSPSLTGARYKLSSGASAATYRRQKS